MLTRGDSNSRIPQMTLDQILQMYHASSAADWHQVHAPLVPETHAHEALYIYKPDVSIVVAENFSDEDYQWDWVEIYADKSAHRFWIDLLYNGVPVYREIAVHVDGGRADLPSPGGYIDSNDPSKGWSVPRDEYEFVRHFSVIRGQERNFDEYYARAERGPKLTIT
jgi:hypothetical protein